MTQMVDLSAGMIHYAETGPRDAPAVVFLHGALVDGSLWDRVLPELPGLRCVVPTLPLGSHRTPLRDRRMATPIGVADLVAEFLERLGLDHVTLVGNDSGGAITQLLLTRRPERIARVVLTNCDAFEHFPPRAFLPLVWLARARLLGPYMRVVLRVGALRDTPLGFGLLHERPLPAGALEAWVRPALSQRGVRRDAEHFASHLDSRLTLEAAEKLGDFPGPVLLAWGADDRIFKISFAERLCREFRDARLIPIAGAKTFVPLDQPLALARAIMDLAASGAERAVDAGRVGAT